MDQLIEESTRLRFNALWHYELFRVHIFKAHKRMAITSGGLIEDFDRTLRNIGLSEAKPLAYPRHEHDPVSDTMDVLAMMQPPKIGLAASPDQLEPAARRLLGNPPSYAQLRLARKDFLIMLSLLLRRRLSTAKRGPRHHYGSLDANELSDAAYEELLMTIGNSLGMDQEEYLTSQQLLKVQHLLVRPTLMAGTSVFNS